MDHSGTSAVRRGYPTHHQSPFKAANLPAFGPHAFRHMLTRHATRSCNSVAELVATQKLGHTDDLTTLRTYGQNDRDRMRALIAGE